MKHFIARAKDYEAGGVLGKRLGWDGLSVLCEFKSGMTRFYNWVIG